ncbi:uncharacterized protein LOC130736653 [Lotus japonicus]|uniref:uncharacterized protein LOC130736653 n=1 Tax=Lotus japonicus TaxID=34305 RepID=UPI0025828945|nr:uncharacterized protein LOC130736653 [Lotus japonicus]
MWSPKFISPTAKVTKTLAWIRIPGLNAAFYDESFLMSVAQVIGTPIRVDINTLRGNRGKFARICVELDLSNPVLGKIMIEDDWYKIEYEGLHVICTKCGCYGHRSRECTRDSPPNKTNTAPEKPLGNTSVMMEGQTVVSTPSATVERPDETINAGPESNGNNLSQHSKAAEFKGNFESNGMVVDNNVADSANEIGVNHGAIIIGIEEAIIDKTPPPEEETFGSWMTVTKKKRNKPTGGPLKVKAELREAKANNNKSNRIYNETPKAREKKGEKKEEKTEFSIQGGNKFNMGKSTGPTRTHGGLKAKKGQRGEVATILSLNQHASPTKTLGQGDNPMAANLASGSTAHLIQDSEEYLKYFKKFDDAIKQASMCTSMHVDQKSNDEQ